MENKRVVKKMTWSKDSMIHPNMIEYNMNWRATDWQKDTQDMAVRLWQQAVLMPNLRGDELIALATGKWVVNITDYDSHFHMVEFIEIQEEEE